jgi:16S rRNA (guanine527-N7)-methyltransferase
VSRREFQERLRRRARSADVSLSPEVAAKLEAYHGLLARWNAKVNLTALRLPPGGEDESIDRLLIEPLAAVRYFPDRATTLLDAGSGGGSPAIPIKLALPQLRVRMVESKTRKAVFLREAVRTLGLAGVDVEATRFEELLARPELHESTDVVTVRAVRIEPKVLLVLQAFLRSGGQLFLFRGSARATVESVTPPLAWKATYPLVDPLRSRLVVFEKLPVGGRR